MDKLFGSIKGFVKLQRVVIDNNVFRLHYKVTVPLLIAFSLLVTSKQYIGDAINCISKDDIPPKVLKTFCWIHTTFSIKESWFKKVGSEIPYPGVDVYKEGNHKVYHAYYQWVCFVLFLQALLFYMPRYFWKVMESNKVKTLVMDLNNPVLTVEKRKASRKLLVDYFEANFNCHGTYFFCYFVSEILNVINVIGQMYLMDEFLGGEFSSFGVEVLKFSDWDWTVRYDPLIRVFPRLTKCTFHRYGSSGDVQKHDAMCILSINIINEKIYIFLWFWFVVLAVLSCLSLAYRVLMYVSSKARQWSLMARVSVAAREDLESVLTKCHAGDWFLIYLLSKNIHTLNFKEFIEDLAERLDNKKSFESV